MTARTLKTTLLSFALAGGVALSAVAEKAPLRDVKAIDDNMLWVAIAIEVSDKCPTIDARKVKGLSFLWSLKAKATDMGYSDEEVRAYVESDAEEARIRAKGESYIKSQGFDPKTAAGLCAVGEQEIARGSIIGSFLRKTK